MKIKRQNVWEQLIMQMRLSVDGTICSQTEWICNLKTRVQFNNSISTNYRIRKTTRNASCGRDWQFHTGAVRLGGAASPSFAIWTRNNRSSSKIKNKLSLTIIIVVRLIWLGAIRLRHQSFLLLAVPFEFCKFSQLTNDNILPTVTSPMG